MGKKALINGAFATTNNDILDIYPFSQKPYQAADSDFFVLFGRIRLANAKCLTKIFFLNAKPQKDLKISKSFFQKGRFGQWEWHSFQHLMSGVHIQQNFSFRMFLMLIAQNRG